MNQKIVSLNEPKNSLNVSILVRLGNANVFK